MHNGSDQQWQDGRLITCINYLQVFVLLLEYLFFIQKQAWNNY